MTHTHTVSPSRLIAGDVILSNGNRVVASVQRDMNNLSAYLIRFTDGDRFHAYEFSAYPIARA